MVGKTLDNWLATLPVRKKRIIKARLAGESLRAIGDKEGISGEYVRVVCRNALRERYTLPEDKWVPLFSRYKWTKEVFCALTGEPERTFCYLCIVARKGQKDPSLLMADENVPPSVKESYHSLTMFDGKVFRYGKYFRGWRKEVLIDALSVLAKEPVPVEEFTVQYQDYLQKRGLRDKISKPATLLPRIWRTRHAVSCCGERFRYFDVDAVNIASLEKEIGLCSITDTAFSLKMLFDKYPEVMAKHGVRDEYELHNLLRLRAGDLSSDISFGRMPMVTAGAGSHKEHIRTLLKEMCGNPVRPVRKEAFAEEYCARYGVSRSSFYSIFHSLLREHKYGGDEYVYKKERLSKKEIASLNRILSEDIYYFNDAEALLVEKLGRKISLVSDAVLWELGYRRCRTLLFNKKYSSAPEALRAYFSAPVRHFNKFLVNQMSVRPFLMEEAEAFRLFRYDEETFVNRQWLLEHGYTEERIKEFIRSVERFAGNGTFSVFSLKKSGFNHEWLRNEKEFYLLSSFLRTSKMFYSRSGGYGTVLFHRTIWLPSFSLVSQEIAKEKQKASPKAVSLVVRERFGVDVPVSYISRALLYGKEGKYSFRKGA